MSAELILSVSDFVAIFNQTLEFAYPSVTITGELANFRVSKNRWVYFDLKDEFSSVRFFGSVQQLPGPLEDGLLLQVRGMPRLHPQYGFSVNVQFMSPAGEGSIKRAAALLEAKMRAEGLFDSSRKRSITYPPARVGLITSGESAAYHDFVKVLNERWMGIDVQLADVQVQGEAAIEQIAAAVQYFNSHAEPVDVLVITRGGGSSEDLAVFNTESVTRAIAGSRIPTMVAIGHEVDISLAELAADKRASTPSNAAQLLVPDKQEARSELAALQRSLSQTMIEAIHRSRQDNQSMGAQLFQDLQRIVNNETQYLVMSRSLIEALGPPAVLRRGYVVVRQQGKVVRSAGTLKPSTAHFQFADGGVDGIIQELKRGK